MYPDLLFLRRVSSYKNTPLSGPSHPLAFAVLIFYTEAQESQYHVPVNIYFLLTCLHSAGTALLQAAGCGTVRLVLFIYFIFESRGRDSICPQRIFLKAKAVAQEGSQTARAVPAPGRVAPASSSLGKAPQRQSGREGEEAYLPCPPKP